MLILGMGRGRLSGWYEARRSRSTASFVRIRLLVTLAALATTASATPQVAQGATVLVRPKWIATATLSPNTCHFGATRHEVYVDNGGATTSEKACEFWGWSGSDWLASSNQLEFTSALSGSNTYRIDPVGVRKAEYVFCSASCVFGDWSGAADTVDIGGVQPGRQLRLAAMACFDQDNGDGNVIAVGDLGLVVGAFGSSPGVNWTSQHQKADLNEDSAVGVGDIGGTVSQFGNDCDSFGTQVIADFM